ncbi:MAG: 2-C-methyl-D-erythritol 2,4-cyclodiphosphate synthase [Candidatus Omnitrophica bacterium]|nr:2-C-methyl-D-erythritol 2,4-cyclodiphosphate synthase [Candidatus Omnitrophota bacterium]
MRVGIGYDIHRLVKKIPMVLGGVSISHTKGPVAHSDGDVLLHAICDAVLGALGRGDIGMMFPDTDPSFKGTDSGEFLEKVTEIMDKDGFVVANLDCTVISEDIKVTSYREQITKNISGILDVSEKVINVKGKTAEGLGETGKGDAIEAHAVVLLIKKDKS